MIINALFEQSEETDTPPETVKGVTELLLTLDEQHRRQQASILVIFETAPHVLPASHQMQPVTTGLCKEGT